MDLKIEGLHSRNFLMNCGECEVDQINSGRFCCECGEDRCTVLMQRAADDGHLSILAFVGIRGSLHG